MKAGEIRRLAKAHDKATLDAACDAYEETGTHTLECKGSDDDERLTNLLLASRVRSLVEGGKDEKEAFREVMDSVKAVIRND